MKAIEILEWICRESIEGEFLNMIDVPEDGDNEWEQNEEWWNYMFGACPPHSIPAGRYLYYYYSSCGESICLNGKEFDADAEIELQTPDGFDCIYLYKPED